MHRLGSFFDMMRVSSSATIGSKGVCFCLAVFEKLAREFDPSVTSCGEKHHLEYDTKPCCGFNPR